MKGQIRNIYPGGNTSMGFYSYYSHILLQKEAQKIICIKGGPGTGKSTMMKRIGSYFAEQGEDVDFLWCSSDPESLDGIVLKKRRVAVLDGTAPHIVDPVNPGAVDCIVNLGDYWDEDAIKPYRGRIMSCDARIKRQYQMAYHYLRIAGMTDHLMGELYTSWARDPKQCDGLLRDIRDELKLKLLNISAVKRALSSRSRGMALGTETRYGRAKKQFISAITPEGLRSDLNSLTDFAKQVIALETPVGFPMDRVLRPCAEWLQEIGFDVETYYCPMDPERKLEHIVVPEAGICIITEHTYHRRKSVTELSAESSTGRRPEKPAKDFSISAEEMIDGFVQQHGMLDDELLCRLEEEENRALDSAVNFLKEAKRLHDELEQCYIPAMDFTKLEEKTQELLKEIRAY